MQGAGAYCGGLRRSLLFSVDTALHTADVSPASPVTRLPGDDVGGGGEEEREFVWDDYLEETRSIAAPATSFKHVSNIHTVNSRTVEQFAV